MPSTALHVSFVVLLEVIAFIHFRMTAKLKTVYGRDLWSAYFASSCRWVRDPKYAEAKSIRLDHDFSVAIAMLAWIAVVTMGARLGW